MRLRRNPQFLAGAVIVTGFALMALLAPALAPHSYKDQDLMHSLLPPAWMAGGMRQYLLGTDLLGRDLLSRLIYGSRVSMAVGFFAVLLAGSLGTLLGMAAGFFGGRIDRVIGWLVDVQLSFPPVFLAIALMAVIGKNLWNLILVLGLVTWVSYARVARAEALSVREREFVQAGRALGAGSLRLLLRHVLPNLLPPLAVIATVNMSAMILAEAALSFLGLGVQPPTPAWGSMVAEGREVLTSAWWVTAFPGTAIALLVMGANLLGEGLRPRR